MISDGFVSIMNLKWRECFYLQFMRGFSFPTELWTWRGGGEVTKFYTRRLLPKVKGLERFPYNPIHLLCMQNYLLCMRSIVFEDNSNSLMYWIYTLIITTYCVNKRGFDCALWRAITRCLFVDSLLPLAPFFSLFLLHITQASYGFFFSSFFLVPSGLEPLTFRIPLAYQFLFYTTTLRDSVENYPSKSNFYFTWLVPIPKKITLQFTYSCV